MLVIKLVGDPYTVDGGRSYGVKGFIQLGDYSFDCFTRWYPGKPKSYGNVYPYNGGWVKVDTVLCNYKCATHSKLKKIVKFDDPDLAKKGIYIHNGSRPIHSDGCIVVPNFADLWSKLKDNGTAVIEI